MAKLLNQTDLAFLLAQVNFGSVPPSGTAVDDPSGIRNVDGTFNNIGGNPSFGVTDQNFLRTTTSIFHNGPGADGITLPGFGPTLFGDNYAQNLNIYDASPRTISNLIADTSQAPVNGGVGNTTPDPLGNDFNALFTTFGQFFDHGLDFVKKGGNGLVVIPILPGDPLYVDPLSADYVPGVSNLMFQSRVTLDGTEGVNSTAPLIDLSQNYGSHESTKFWLKEYDVNGVATGNLLSSADGGEPTWADVKANSQRLFDAGITSFVLDDSDAINMRDHTTGLRTGQIFLADIAHSADPGRLTTLGGTSKVADADNIIGNTPVAGEYDDELLDAHFVAGDGRLNENIALLAVHESFHTEHNRLVDMIKDMIAEQDVIEPGYAAQWTGDMIFEAAKLVNESQYQHHVFEEFARRISPNVTNFSAYDVNINPNITAEFAHAVYRLGHSMVTETVQMVDAVGNASSVSLIDAFLNPGLFDQIGAADITQGMTRLEGNEIDEFVTNGVRNFLVGLPLDLAALNIARGRETGVGTLNEVRADLFAQTGDLSLAAYTSWNDFGANLLNASSLVNFIAAYSRDAAIVAARVANNLALARSLAQDKINNDTAFMEGGDLGFNDVDLWIGGLAEAKVVGGLLGSTFDFIFAQQMIHLQDGDRFYYLGRGLGNILTQIEGETFKDIFERGTGARHLNGDTFSVVDQYIELSTQSASLIDNQHEVIGGTTGNDNINASGGNDTVYGEQGNDIINGGAGQDHVYGGAGDDTINDTSGDDVLHGNDGNDNINGGTGIDFLFGDLGNDTLNGGAGDDTINGNEGIDIIIGGTGNDRITGGTENDNISGGDGDDRLDGDEGHDFIDGGAGIDRINGGEGDDLLIGGAGADSIDGGVTGIDTASYQTSSSGVVVNLLNPAGNTGDAAGDTYLSIENVRGSNGSDNVTGDANNNILEGLGNNDTLNGGGGDDILVGGAGNDTLLGDIGTDIAKFTGNFADYVVAAGAAVVVTDNIGGRDGTDTLQGVEFLQFADRIVSAVNTSTTLPLVTLTNILNNVGGAAHISESTSVPIGLNPGVRIADIVITDPDAVGVNTLSVAGTDAALFQIRNVSGVTSLYFTGAAFNYEARNTYDVQVNVNDPINGPLVDSVAKLVLNITDVNDSGVRITSLGHANVLENTPATTPFYFTDIVDSDTVGTHTYSLTGADAALFSIDSFGEVRFIASPDFENPSDADGDNTYEFIVNVSDGAGHTDTQTVNVRVTNANDTSVQFFTPTGSASVVENTAGTVFDANAFGGGTIYYSLGGADAGRFNINSATGQISFSPTANFENPLDVGSNNVYDLIVTANDGTTSATQAVTITVTNANDNAPVFFSAAATNVNENASVSTVVYVAGATDADNLAPLTYTISGADAGDFTINSVTGEVRFVVSPNHEAPADADLNNVYDIVVTAFDGTNVTNKSVSITVNNLNDNAPVFTSAASTSVNENTAVGTVVYDANATDADNLTSLVYSISGTDAADFSIDSATGEVRFVASPNHEAPADANGNNVYDIVVTASDGTNATNKSVSITVNNLNDNAPAFTSGATASIEEHSASGIIVYNASTTDADLDTVSYSLTGVDAQLFNINSSGAVSFNVQPDFEAPSDNDGNNVYDFTVVANDGVHTVNKIVSLVVTNVAPIINDPNGNNFGNIVGTSEEDTISGFGGNDTIRGKAGTDTLNGDNDDDTFVYMAGDQSGLAGENVNGGLGNDRILVDGTFDFRTVAMTSIEGLAFEDSSAAVRDVSINASQFGTQIASNTLIDGSINVGSSDRLSVFMGSVTTLDLLSLTFSDWNTGGQDTDRITIWGDSDAETIKGSSQIDEIRAGEGSDYLDGRAGKDFLFGGIGDDIYFVDTQGEAIEAANEGLDTVSSSASYQLGDNLENLLLTGSAVTGTGNSLSNRIAGTGGNNVLNGLAGADTVIGGDGNDTIYGGEGADSLYGGLGADLLDGGDDVGVVDYARYDDANHGNLTIRLDAPNLNTGAAAGDTYVGIEGLVGGAGSDTVVGNASANYLFGVGGNDNVYGQDGADYLNGGEGTNQLWGGAGSDTHIGGSGLDFARYDEANWGNLTIRLDVPSLNTGAAAGDTYTGIEGLVGGTGNDIIVGNASNNYLFGGGGSDYLNGLAGSDYLSGGAGADRFAFGTALNAATNVDTVADFAHGVDDFNLTQTIFASIGATLDATEFRFGAAAADAKDFLIYNGATGQLFYDANGNAAGGQTLFAMVAAGTVLDIGDFVMV